MKPTAVNPYDSSQHSDADHDRVAFTNRSLSLRRYARLSMLFAIVGVVALPPSIFVIGDWRFVFAGIAYLGGLCWISFGYYYASIKWRVPNFMWLGAVPQVLLGLIYCSVALLGPDHFDFIGRILHLVLWAFWILFGLIVLSAIAGWVAYWRDREIPSA